MITISSPRSCAIACLFTLFVPAFASAEVVRLEDLEAIALRNQTHLAGLKARAQRSLAEVDVRRAARRPSVRLDASGLGAPGGEVVQIESIDGNVVNVRASPTLREENAFSPNLRWEATLLIDAPLYDFGRTKAAINAAKSNKRASRAQAELSNEAIVRRVRAAYLDWLGATLIRDFALESVEAAVAQRERIAARVQAGDRPGSELDSARYEEMDTRLSAEEAQAQVSAIKRLLESEVGQSLPDDAEPDKALLQREAISVEPVPAWELEDLERRRNATRLEAKMYRKSRAPLLAAVGRTGVNGLNENVFPSYRLGLTLAMPLWDGGDAKSRARTLEAEARELDALLEESRAAVQNERLQAQGDRVNAERQLDVANELVEICHTRVGHAQNSYDLGVGDLHEIAQARAALRDAQSRRAIIQVARADAVLRLME